MMQKNKIANFPHLVPFCQALSHITKFQIEISVQALSTEARPWPRAGEGGVLL